MVISRVDRHILRSVAEMDGIRCGLLEIAERTGCDYKNAHRRLRHLECAGLLRVDRRGQGRRLLISATSLGLLMVIGARQSGRGVPVRAVGSLQIAVHNRVLYEQ